MAPAPTAAEPAAPTRTVARARRALGSHGSRWRSSEGATAQRELAEAAVAGDRQAAGYLVDSYAPLLRSLARRLGRIPGVVEVEDLVAVGQAAACVALARMDPQACDNPLSFLLPRMRGAMIDHLRSLDTRPRSVLDGRKQLARRQHQLEQTRGHNVTAGEAAADLGLGEETAAYLHRSIGEVSRDALPWDGRDLHPVDESAEVSDRIAACDELARALRRLPARQRQVLVAVVVEGRPATEVAEQMGVTGSRVSQLKSQALERMRESLAAAS